MTYSEWKTNELAGEGGFTFAEEKLTLSAYKAGARQKRHFMRFMRCFRWTIQSNLTGFQIRGGYMKSCKSCENTFCVNSGKGCATPAAHKKMLNFDRDIQDLCERAWGDGARLEWLLRHVSGAEFRRLGIVYSAGCSRDDIDNAMRAYHPPVKA